MPRSRFLKKILNLAHAKCLRKSTDSTQDVGLEDMIAKWRWDQGRLDYFQFDTICTIAHVLTSLENVEINVAGIDPLRTRLEKATGLPYSPASYRVWRNYGRTFACAFLATKIDNRLFVTDICRALAGQSDSKLVSDDYLGIFARKFSYPFPAFQGYDPEHSQIFPVIAVIKFLLANIQENGLNEISLEDVFIKIIGNNCTGIEDLEFYKKLKRKNYSPQGDELRQVRELLIFVSQISFFKWQKNRLYLDIDVQDADAFNTIERFATPAVTPRKKIAEEELLQLGLLKEKEIRRIPVITREVSTDITFSEGKKVRVSHIRTERSPKLRSIFFSLQRRPFLCDMCRLDVCARYQWTENILEIHHLLPLSSAVAVNSKGTALTDVVPLCPNCHKSVHLYYSRYLNGNKIEDFRTKEEAHEVYQFAKESVA